MDPFMHANAVFARCVWITLVVLVLVWIVKYMGGFATSPDDTGPNSNDTSSLFNWHPFLMILAFPVFMTEALFTYIAPPLNAIPRQAKKIVHGILQTIVLILMVLSLVAVFRSHTQKEPKAMDDLYSPHSYMGICTMVAFGFQFFFGNLSFVLPVLTPAQRALYAPYHRFFGMAAYLIGMATIMAGIQEKSTFNRGGGRHIHFKGSYEPLSVIAAVMAPLIIILAASVAFHGTFFKAPSIPEEPVTEEGPSQEAQQPLVKESAEQA